MSNIAGAIAGQQAVIRAANKQREEARKGSESIPEEASGECSCSAIRVLFLGGCRCSK